MKLADLDTTATNLDGYDAPTIEWPPVAETFTHPGGQEPGAGGPDRHTTWLSSIDPDGRPHVTPLGAIVVDGHIVFTSGPGTRKSQNLERDPRCTLSLATEPYDVVVEGTAARVTDADLLATVASHYAEQGWPASVDPGGEGLTAEFSAPAAGPPPWSVYEVTPQKVWAHGTAEPYGSTRFDIAR